MEGKRREVVLTHRVQNGCALGNCPALPPKTKGRNNSGVSYWAPSFSFSLPAKLYFPKSAKAKFVLCHWVEMTSALEAEIILAL